MSTTPENPDQNQPPYQPPQQHQPPQQPAQDRPNSNFTFEMPADAPKSLNEALPKGGFSGIFNVNGLPTLLKVSYLIWIIGAGIWLLSTIFGLILSFTLLGRKGEAISGTGVYDYTGDGIRGIIVSLIALVVIAAIVVSAMKLKEGLQWPRLALTILAIISFILMFFGAGLGILAVVATVLMWLPESSAWINSRKGNAA